MTKVELAYIAGIVDGEGYIGIKKMKAYKCQGRVNPGYQERIQVRMVNEEAIRFIAETLGGWYYPEKPTAIRGRTLFCFQVSDISAVNILKKIIPFLRIKRESALTVLKLRDLKKNSYKYRTKVTGYRDFPNSHGTIRKVANLSYSDEYISACESLWLRCKELNRPGI